MIKTGLSAVEDRAESIVEKPRPKAFNTTSSMSSTLKVLGSADTVDT